LEEIAKMLFGAADINNHEKRFGDVHRIANGKRYKNVRVEKVDGIDVTGETGMIIRG
jgi:hypothetical protein